jgi:hypothetical protein
MRQNEENLLINQSVNRPLVGLRGLEPLTRPL